MIMTVGLLLALANGDGDPVSILKQADHASQQLERVSYRARAWGEGALRGQISSIHAHVRAMRAAEGLPRLHLRASVREPGAHASRERVIVRGATHLASSLDGESTTFEIRDGNARLQPIISAVWMRELAITNPFRDELNADLQHYEGVRRVGGVECHVVYVVYADRRGEARWYFGKADMLPRRVDRILAAGVRVLEITELDTSPELDAAVFDVATDKAGAATDPTR